MNKLLTSQHSRFFWLGLAILLTTSLIFYLILPFLGIDHQAMSFRQFIYHSFWRVVTTGFFLFLLLRYFDRKFELKQRMMDQTYQRYEALGRATNDAIWDYDFETGHTYYNERVEEIFGYSKTDLANNPQWWKSNIHPEDKIRVAERMERSLTGMNPAWEDEYRFMLADGSWKIVYDRSYIIRDANGKPVRMIGAMKDVTELRRLEREIHEQQLREKNLKGQGIIRSYEQDRKIIRDALHEDVNQILAAIKMHMADSRAREQGYMSTTSIDHLDTVIQKIRKISNRLSSFTFEFMGLCEAIRELVLVRDLNPAIIVDFNHDGFEEALIKKDGALQLFRVTEFVLESIPEEMQSARVDIRLTTNSGQAQLTITCQSPVNWYAQPEYDQLKQELQEKLEMFNGSLEFRSPSPAVHIISAMVRQ